MDPLPEVKSKTLGTGIPSRLRAYPEEVEVRTVHFTREEEVQTGRYDEISEGMIDRGMTVADLGVRGHCQPGDGPPPHVEHWEDESFYVSKESTSSLTEIAL
jgi:hypothetical protein